MGTVLIRRVLGGRDWFAWLCPHSRVELVRNTYFQAGQVAGRLSFRGFNAAIEKYMATVHDVDRAGAGDGDDDAVNDKEMMKRFTKYVGLRGNQGGAGQGSSGPLARGGNRGSGGGGGGSSHKKTAQDVQQVRTPTL